MPLLYQSYQRSPKMTISKHSLTSKISWQIMHMSIFFSIADLKNLSSCNVIQQLKEPQLSEVENGWDLMVLWHTMPTIFKLLYYHITRLFLVAFLSLLSIKGYLPVIVNQIGLSCTFRLHLYCAHTPRKIVEGIHWSNIRDEWTVHWHDEVIIDTMCFQRVQIITLTGKVSILVTKKGILNY